MKSTITYTLHVPKNILRIITNILILERIGWPLDRENRKFSLTWTNREMTGILKKNLIKNDFNFFLMCYIKWLTYVLYHAFQNSILICAKRASNLSAGV